MRGGESTNPVAQLTRLSPSNSNTPSKSSASVTVTDIGSLDIQHTHQLSDVAKLKLLKYSNISLMSPGLIQLVSGHP